MCKYVRILVVLAIAPITIVPSSRVAGESATGLASWQSLLPNKVEQVRAVSGVPGITVALLEGDDFLAVSAGLRAAAPAAVAAMTPADQLHIGSNFKAFTATIVGRLVDRGLLTWDSTLGQIYGNTVSTIDTQMASVTIRQLLAHRGGIDDNAVAELLGDADLGQQPREIRATAVPLILHSPPQLTPGKFAYSNIGYAIAGAVIEQVTNRDFADVVQTELAEPLGITTLRLGPPGTEDLATIVEPLGHDADGHPMVPSAQGLPDGLEPAGDFQISIEDWAKFIRVQMGLQDSMAPYLSPAQLQVIQTPVGGLTQPNEGIALDYGLGWGILDVEGNRLLQHNGSNTFWASSAIVNPKLQRALLLGSNQEETGFVAESLLLEDPEIRSWLLADTVPEPSSSALVLLSIAVALARRHRR